MRPPASATIREPLYLALFSTIFRLPALLVIAGLAAGCGDTGVDPGNGNGGGGDPVASVTVSPPSSQLTALGQTVQLTAVAKSQSGSTIAGKVFAWSSSNTGVVTVSGSGLVTATGSGAATVTAGVDGRSGDCGITVAIGIPLDVILNSGDYWDYFWISESQDFAQGSDTDYDVAVGRYRVTLGSPTTVAGVQAYPVTVTGETHDGVVELGPRWTHLAVDAGGSLLGSENGTTLVKIYDATSDEWTGGGFFVPFPGDQPMEAGQGTFSGAYNQLAAIVVGRNLSSGGCTYYPSVGETICVGDPMSITEREYYKRGVGPLGYFFESSVSYSGGGFYTSHKRTRTVELIASNHTPTDGGTFSPPPWDEAAPLQTARHMHAATVLDGKIYVIGGHDGNDYLTSVEVYDPTTNSWSYGTRLPEATAGAVAATVDGRIFVVRPNNSPILMYNPARGIWSSGSTVPYSDPSHDGCAMADAHDQYVVTISPNGAFTGKLNVFIYPYSTGTWFNGVPYTTSDHRWFSVACIGTDMYVVGGYQQFMTEKVFGGVRRYDALNGIWEGWVASLNQRRYSSQSVALDDKIVTLGGRTATTDLRAVEQFDPATDQWTVLPGMFRPRVDFDAVVLNGKVYVIGGKSGATILGQVEVYTP